MGAMFGGPNATPETLKPIAEGIMTSMRTAPEDAYAKRLEQTIASMVATESMRAGALEERFEEPSRDALLDEEPRPREADLTRVVVLVHGLRDGGVEVGVGEDDER